MNKKFFTFLAAGALLLSSVTVSAAVRNTAAVGDHVGQAARSLVEGANRGLYQLHLVGTGTTSNATPAATIFGITGNQVLVVNSLNGHVGLEDGNAVGADLSFSLWCAEISAEAGGKNPSFTFLNKGYGDNLTVEERGIHEGAAKRLTLDGAVSDWKFSAKYGTSVILDEEQLLYSYVGTDSVLILAVATVASTGINVGDLVYIKESVDVATKGAAIETADVELAFFTLVEAAPQFLNAAALNTKLGTVPTGAQKLVFTPDVAGAVPANEFSSTALTATDVTGIHYVTLHKGSTTKNYLRVDTALINKTGDPYLNFAYSKDNEDLSLSAIEDQYKFRFTYYPSFDSLTINVFSAVQPNKSIIEILTGGDAAKPWWFMGATNSVLATAAGTGYRAGFQASDDTFNASTGPTDLNLDDFTYVVLQDLAGEGRVLTVGELPAQTRIGLGLGDCATQEKPLLEEDLYVIKNGNHYLAVPVHNAVKNNSVAGGGDAVWVDITNSHIDPFQEPAFQWLVTGNSKYNVTITNREFNGITATASTSALDNIFGNTASIDENNFIPVPAAQKEDPYLGYKAINLENEDWKMKKYSFRYLHNFNLEQYLGLPSATDTVLYIKPEAKTRFVLVPQQTVTKFDPAKNDSALKNVEYGAWIDRTKDATSKLQKLAKLERTAYVLKINDANKLIQNNKYVVTDRDHNRYVVTDGADNIQTTDGGLTYNLNQEPTNAKFYADDVAIFFLKTNNTKGGENYYALIDTASARPTPTPGNDNPFLSDNMKVGIDDASLQARYNKYDETRTSAFALVEDESPLYRRLDRAVDNNEGIANDTPDVLKFHSVTRPNEFLYEDNSSVFSKDREDNPRGPHYLGFSHKTEFTAGDRSLGIYVDTAYVNRPAIAGLKDITPKPQYMLVVGARVVNGTTIVDPNGCDPDIIKEGYLRGRYLINATDSAKKALTNNITDVEDANYVAWDPTQQVYTQWERLVFTDAIHYGDSLYILNGQNYIDGQFDPKDLVANKNVTIVDLANNHHKDVVFSFRLVEEETAAYADQVQNFLIESENEVQKVDKHTSDGGTMIAPFEGGWVKIQNGVPVISRGAYGEAISQAELFNVVAPEVGSKDENATNNTEVEASAVAVVAGNGVVTVSNVAAGKTIVVSNVLGQTVASTVSAGDVVTVAAPQGIVFVTVDGGAAVRAIVK